MSIAPPSREIPWAHTAASGDVVEPADVNKGSGWLKTTDPFYQWFNWILRQASRWIKYLRTRGIADYFSDETYSPGDICRYSGVAYIRIGSGDTAGVGPHQDATKWQLWLGSIDTAATGISATNSATLSDILSVKHPNVARELSMKVQLGASQASTVITLEGVAIFGMQNVQISGTSDSVRWSVGIQSTTGDAHDQIAIGSAGDTYSGGGLCFVRAIGY